MIEMPANPAHSDAIAEAAAQWCMRLNADDCTAQERLEFEHWLATDTRHGEEFAAMQDIWALSDQLPRATPALPLKRRPQALRRWAVAAAISLVALPLAAFTGWNVGWLPDTYQHESSHGSLRQVVLGDGSKVELNLDSELTYTHFKDRRQVRLTRGEAFFEVTHDALHPFVVKAAEGRVKVTGTRFNVWKYQDQVRVTLVEGSVLVSSINADPDGGFRLSPGMQARYKAGDYEPQLLQTYAGDTSLAWRDGKLILDNLPLVDALPLINRYLEKPLVLGDDHSARIRIGGVYDTARLKTLANSLPKVLPIYLTQNNDGDTVLNSIPSQP
ncbi:FecR family protein [Pseudomonas sp. M47T1]|uniref:FecR family protein n=1 Tax=Pseudomonas sp. M47T1 TaxID=1179778 RepID=UPI003FCF186D